MNIPPPLPELHLQTNSRPVMHWTGRTGERIDLDAPYQRGSVWTVEQRRNLIKSLIQGIPTGAIVIAFQGYGEEVCYRIVDGKQRIETIQAFYRGDFTVPGHWFRAGDLVAGVTARSSDITYADLNRNGQYRFEFAKMPELEFDATTETTHKPDGFGTGKDRYDFRKRTPAERLAAEAELYVLINFGGVPQTDADRARAQKVADR